jgi:hypothetical protein
MMNDDIVTRLRQLAGAMSEARFPALEATALQAAAEIERLRGEIKTLDRLGPLVLRANAAILKIRAERDDARREVCHMRPSVCLGSQTANAYADQRGWDCFKEVKK